MISGIYSAISGVQAQIQKFDVSANNVANVSTTGFKAKRADIVSQSSGGVEVRGTSTYSSQGPLLRTEMPGDLAIAGSGYFQVETSSGDVQYTRSAAFTEDAEGYLRTSGGEYLRGQSGRVQIPASAQSYSVGSDGSVTIVDASGNTSVGDRIDLAVFSTPESLSSVGGNLYEATSASGSATVTAAGQNGAGNIVSGALEGSNVDLVNESVSMMLAQRMMEANIKTIQVADEMLKTLTEIKKSP